MANQHLKNKGQHRPMGQGGPQTPSTAGEQSKESSTLESMKERAQETASRAGQSVADAGTAMGEKANEAAAALGTGMQSAAEQVRQRGPAGSWTGGLADSLESGGRYLQQDGATRLLEDVAHVIRRNPLPAFVAGIALGYFLAQQTSRR